MAEYAPFIVFIIDDSLPTRETLRLMVQQSFKDDFPHLNLVIHQAASFEAATKISYFEQAKITFLDINLPDGNGISFLKVCQESRPEMGVIMVSGESTIENVRSSMNGGALSFIVKPFSLRKVKDSIAYYFKRLKKESEAKEGLI